MSDSSTHTMNSDSEMSSTFRPWVHRAAVSLAVATLLLVFVGSGVTGQDAGMAFPDWPTSNGELVNPDGWLSANDKLWEHGHRLLGWLVGMGSITMVFVAARQRNEKLLLPTAVFTLVAIIAQGVMGGARVTQISTAWAVVHGVWGQICFSLTCCMAAMTGPAWAQAQRQPGARGGAIRAFAAVTPLLLVAQLSTGALTRHFAQHFAFHFIGAMVVTAALTVWLMLLDGEVRRAAWVRRWMIRLAMLLGFQLTLGMVTYLATGGSSSRVSSPRVWEWLMPTMHVVVGALLLASTFVTSLFVFRFVESSRSCLPHPSTLPASAP